MRDNSRGGPSGRLRFECEEQTAGTSGHVGPKSKPGAKSRKRLKTHADTNAPPPISEGPDDATPPVEDAPATSGQLGPKSQNSKYRQYSKQARPSERLRHEDETPPGGATAAEDGAVPRDGPADKKAVRAAKKRNKSKLCMEKSGEKLDTAREKLAAQKPPKRPGPVKAVGRAAGHQAWRYAHGKIHEIEHENVGVEAAHKTELAAEKVVRGGTRFIKKRIRTRPARKVRKWEKKNINARADYGFRTLAQENPELAQNALSRFYQKRRIKKQYQKQAREAARKSAKAVKKTAGVAEKVAGAVWRFVGRNPKVILILGCAFLLIVVLQSCMAGLTSIGNGLIGAVGGTSYVSSDSDIETTEADYTALEADLRNQLAHIESDYPGYDEYRYTADEIGHDPYELASYLTTKYSDYTPATVRAELQALIRQQYTLTTTQTVEVRYRTETRTHTWTETDPETGETTTYTETYEVQIPYNYYILNVTLKNNSLGTVIAANLNTEQKERYAIYQRLQGNRPYLFAGNIYAHPCEHTDYKIPPEALADPEFAALIAEAEKYLGYPYIWGGSKPSTSFDCSGFVCWVLNQSGVASVGRTNARGLYGMSVSVSPEGAQPGDLIFFTGARAAEIGHSVTHVGIYVGNGMMVHCASGGVQYASIHTPYWTKNFFAFGRLP